MSEDRPPPAPLLPDDRSPLDLEAVGRRLRQRARRRAAVRGGAVAVVLVLGALALPWGSLDGDRAPVHLAVGTATPQTPAPRDPAPQVPGDQTLPTALPTGYVRCAGPISTGAVTRTTFCTPTDAVAPDLVLDQGPHWALPELGTPVRLAQRTGHLHRTADRTTLTVSDATSDDDTHHALTVADPDHPADGLRATLASIPAVAGAPPER